MKLASGACGLIICFAFVVSSVGAQVVPTLPANCILSRSLSLGFSGEDVRLLQKILNKNSATQIALNGNGSAGFETTYFGPATQAAVARFQALNAAAVLTPAGLTVPNGYVGPLTRTALQHVCAQPIGIAPSSPITPTSPTTATPPNAVTTSETVSTSKRAGTTFTVPVKSSKTAFLNTKFEAATNFPSGVVWNATKQTLAFQPATPAGIYTFKFRGIEGNRLNNLEVKVTLRPSSLVTTATTPPPPPSSPFSVTCGVQPTVASINQQVSWRAFPTGGSGTYYYLWNGTDGLTGSSQESKKSYSSSGAKLAAVGVSDGYTQKSSQCPQVTVTSTVAQNQAPVAQAQTVTYYKQRSLDKYTNNVIGWFLIAGASHYEPYRRVLWAHQYVTQIANGTFNYWYDHFLPMRNQFKTKGFERMIIWIPFGTTGDEQAANAGGGADLTHVLGFTDFNRAQQQTPWLTARFVEFWKPYVASSGVEVIAYIGNPDTDSLMKTLASNPTVWMARAFEEVAPFLDSGMSIAFDYIVFGTQNSLSAQFARQLQQRGVRVYVENPPPQGKLHWNEFGIILAEWPTGRNDADCDDINPNNNDPEDLCWMLSPEEAFKGEVIGFDLIGPYDSAFYNQFKQWIAGAPGVPPISISTGYPFDQPGQTGTTLKDLIPTNTTPTTADKTVHIELTASDPNSDPITYAIASQPSRGTIVKSPIAPNKFIYTAQTSFTSGTDSFTFTANDGTLTSSPGTVTVRADTTTELPVVTSEQLMAAARAAGAGLNPVVSVWPLRQADITELNLSFPADFTPKRVFTFKVGSGIRSYVAGYDSWTRQPKAILMNNPLITQARVTDYEYEPYSGDQGYFAAATASDGSLLSSILWTIWNGLLRLLGF